MSIGNAFQMPTANDASPASTPRLSVLIPAYNTAAYLPATLASVVPQLCDRDELVIVDDGSTDGTWAYLRSLEDPRIRIFQRPNSGTPSAPRNYAMHKARGDAFVFLDSDDLMRPEKLQYLREALQRFPSAGLICSDFGVVDANGARISASFVQTLHFHKTIKGHDHGNHPFFYLTASRALELLARENFVGTSSAALRREVFDQVGGFDESLTAAEDMDLWFRVARHYPCVYIDCPLHDYRRFRFGNIGSNRQSRLAQSALVVLVRQLDAGGNDRFAVSMKKRIQDTLFSQAYDHFSHDETRDARAALYAGSRRFWDRRHWMLLGKAALGSRLSCFLRKVKRRMRAR